jgi:arylsulfatase
MDTPFQWTKQVASHFGGTRNGLVISWPQRIKDKGGIRTQFHHVIDIAPTILEAVGLQTPSVLNGVPQKPVEGVSMVYTFDNSKAPSMRRTQYFEMFANRALYNDGWVACTTPPLAPWAVGKTIDVDDYKWELYDVSKDFSQAENLAAREPKKLRELQELFWIEAAKYNVLPLDNSKIERMSVDNRPSLTRGRTLFTFYPGTTRVPEGTAPSILNKSFEIAGAVEIPEGGAEGVLATQGGRFNGWGLYLLKGKPVFHYNVVDVHRYTVAGPQKLSPGKHTILVDFKYDGPGLGKGGTAALMVDGKKVAEGKLERTIPFRISADETLDIGEDTGTPVSEDYHVPFKFTGKLFGVAIKLGEEKLSPEDQKTIDDIRAKIGLSR